MIDVCFLILSSAFGKPSSVQVVFFYRLSAIEGYLSVSRHGGINRQRPRVDAARQALDLLNPGALEELDGLHAPHTVMTIHNHLLIGIQLAEPGGQLPQRNKHGLFKVTVLVLNWLSHVHEQHLAIATAQLLV
jgi:hypothetical protein